MSISLRLSRQGGHGQAPHQKHSDSRRNPPSARMLVFEDVVWRVLVIGKSEKEGNRQHCNRDRCRERDTAFPQPGKRRSCIYNSLRGFRGILTPQVNSCILFPDSCTHKGETQGWVSWGGMPGWGCSWVNGSCYYRVSTGVQSLWNRLQSVKISNFHPKEKTPACRIFRTIQEGNCTISPTYSRHVAGQ